MTTRSPEPSAATTSARAGRRRWLRMAGLGVLALLLAAGPALWLRVRAARLLLATFDSEPAGGLLALDLAAVRVEPETIALAGGRSLRSYRYRTAGRGDDTGPALILLHGVHRLGIDAPRLQRLARAYAASGVEVHTPELEQLLALDVDPRVITQIAACADALRVQRGGRKLGAFAISFTGGLLLMAAASDEGARSLSFVAAVGSHHDLRRVALHFAGERARGPDGQLAPAVFDPYGGQVLVAAYADALFAPSDVALAREALGLYLSEQYAAGRAAVNRLSPAGAARLRPVLTPDGRGVAPLMRELVESQSGSLAALSPAGHLRRLRLPALLMHGVDDPIVPSTETAWLARELPAAQLERVLITPVLRHAEASAAPAFGDQLAVVSFVAAILADSR